MAYTVNPKVHWWEGAINTAAASIVVAAGIHPPAVQRGTEKLDTPRVEFKTALGAFGPNTQTPHKWINQSDKTLWPDTRDGQLFAKIVTRRGEKGQDHDATVATVRGLFQSCSALSGRMQVHKVERIVEGASAIGLLTDQHHDETTLSFDFRMRILYGVGLNEGQPNPDIFITIEA